MDKENAAEESTITVSEYIAQQEQLEKEAKELFPKKFDLCSNGMGYIRQPVYACLTCNPNPSEEAGFCYSCSISCHGDHDLVELFTKRSFRCDCGTAKFKTVECKLDPKPAGSVNELNLYNHNYLGQFCWCNVQYDPAKEESTMLQCVVCEDWFHDTCIGINPHNDDFDDFICRTCTRAHPFLRRYAQHSLFVIGVSEKGGGPKSVVIVDCSKDEGKETRSDKDMGTSKEGLEDEQVDVVTETEAKTESAIVTTVNTTSATVVATSTSVSSTSTTIEEDQPLKRSLASTVEDETDSEARANKKVKVGSDHQDGATEATKCKLDQQPQDKYPDQEVNLFATEGWRDLLCQCTSCVALYTDENVPFILGEEAVYEDDDDEDAETSIMEGGMKKLSELEHTKVIDSVLAYNTMRDEIKSFLAPFSEQGKVVTADDIQAFFAAKMEQRAQNGRPNFF